MRLWSPYLYGCRTFADALAGAVGLVEQVFGVGSVMSEQLGSLHIYADFYGWVPQLADLQSGRLTCSAVVKVEAADYYPGDTIYSAWWGKRGGATMQARLYDKGKEIAEQSQHKRYLLDNYREGGWSEELGPVYRLEFEYSREYLRDRGIECVDQVELPALYSEGMAWLKLRDVVPGDSNHARWPLASAWVEIEGQAVARLGELRRHYEKLYQPKPTVEALAAQILGCVAGVGALTGVDDLETLLVFLRAHGENRLEKQGLSFADMVAARRDRYRVV